jgi:hypothetical protein
MLFLLRRQPDADHYSNRGQNDTYDARPASDPGPAQDGGLLRCLFRVFLREPIFYVCSGDIPTLEAANRRTRTHAVLGQLKPDVRRSQAVRRLRRL